MYVCIYISVGTENSNIRSLKIIENDMLYSIKFRLSSKF